jgi:hypothetical protein
MTELSPAAQAVLTSYNQRELAANKTTAIAAIIRAVAKHCKCDDGEGYWIYRPNLLSIADEIENY